jgi:hypothetical protein
MGIIEILIMLVGPAITRMMLIRWLGNPDLSKDLAGGLNALISQSIKEKRAQLKAERIFSDIGEDIAESLMQVFNIEGVDISDDRKKVIAQAVSETLPRDKVDSALSSLLLKYDLQPNLISKYLLSNRHHSQNLEGHETQLYERIVDEACNRMLRIASELPSFQVKTVAELLRRDTELKQKTDEVLSKVDQIYADSFARTENTNLRLGRFEHEYRSTIASKMDNVEIFGLDVRGLTSRKHRLSVAYVTLKLIDFFENALDTPSALANGQHILIKGEAGSGKTTLLQWIAVRAANNDFVQEAPSMLAWSDSFPFFIRLRDYAKDETVLPPPEDWPRLAAPNIASEMPNGWVHDKLRNGKAIVLIDGLDEISDAKKHKVIEWLTDLINSYRLSKFVISSRPEAAKEISGILWPVELKFSTAPIDNFIKELTRRETLDKTSRIQERELENQAGTMKETWRKEAESSLSFSIKLSDRPFRELTEKIRSYLKKEELTSDIVRKLFIDLLEKWQIEALRIWDQSLEVQRMSDDAIYNFVTNWHKAVADAEGNLTSQQESLFQMANHLTAQLRSHRSLKDLATNPLLCAMLCALHRDRQQDLPKDRINLYRACLSTLLAKRDEKKGVDRGDYPDLSEDQLHLLLQDLSYWMMRNDYTASAPKEEVGKRLDKRLERFIKIEKTDGHNVLRLLIERTGIIREPVDGKIDFTHRTFQEFLAAEAIIDEGDVRALDPYLPVNEWHEVIVLTAGLASQQNLIHIFGKLLDLSKNSPSIDETKTASHEVRKKIFGKRPRRKSREDFSINDILLQQDRMQGILRLTIESRINPDEIRKPKIKKTIALNNEGSGYSIGTPLTLGRMARTTEPKIDERKTLSLLGIDCLGTVRELGDEAKELLLQLLQYAAPPASIEEARIISKAHILALPYLSYSRCKRPEESLGCIDALDMIGGDEARNYIIAIAQNTSHSSYIANKFFSLWETWSIEDVAMTSAVQNIINNAGFLRLNFPENLSLAVERFDLTRINSLELTNCESITDWELYKSLMWNMRNMVKLRLGKWQDIEALKPLFKLPVVREIVLDSPVKIPRNLYTHSIEFRFANNKP